MAPRSQWAPSRRPTCRRGRRCAGAPPGRPPAPEPEMPFPMADRLAACIVPEGGTIRDALAATDAGASGIALAVDGDGRLVGIVTDGDLRRAILRGMGLDDPVAPVLN